MKRNKQLLTGFAVCTLAVVSGAVRAAGSELPNLDAKSVKAAKSPAPAARAVAAAEPPPSEDAVIALAIMANRHLVQIVQKLDLTPALPAEQQIVREELAAFADRSAQLPNVVKAIRFFEEEFQREPNIDHAYERVRDILPFLALEGPERTIRGIPINPGDPLDSPIQLATDGPYGVTHHVHIPHEITVADQAYWTGYYNLQRAMDEASKEMHRYLEKIARMQVGGLDYSDAGFSHTMADGETWCLNDYRTNRRLHGKKSAVLDSQVEEWRSAPGLSNELSRESEDVLSQAVYHMPNSANKH